MFAQWRKKSPDQYSALVFAVASGLVAGEALMSIPNAVLEMLEVPKLTG